MNYALALSEYGEQYVHKYVGREPSGRFFNEICLDTEGRPHNPMINAGAIMTVGLYKPELAIGDRFDRYLETFKAATGGEHLSFNASVFLSERESADRNNALSYFMRENNCYPAEGKDKFQKSLELYSAFKLCRSKKNRQFSMYVKHYIDFNCFICFIKRSSKQVYLATLRYCILLLVLIQIFNAFLFPVVQFRNNLQIQCRYRWYPRQWWCMPNHWRTSLQSRYG